MDYDVFLSLLALDSYNRRYNQKLLLNAGDSTDQDESGRSIGGATILNIDLPSGSVGAGFYAIAYNWDGKTIISYRGTDNYELLDSASDLWNGWGIGVGFTSPSQAALAIDFYEAVKGGSIYEGSDVSLVTGNPIVTVGHSLGGGLAGFVGALGYGESYGFDHMPFLEAAGAQAFSETLTRAVAAASAELGEALSIPSLISYLPSGAEGPLGTAYYTFVDAFTDGLNELEPFTGTMTAFHLDGEVLEAIRTGDPEVLANLIGGTLLGDLLTLMFNNSVIGPALLASGIFAASEIADSALVTNNPISNYGLDLEPISFEPIDLHSQALLTILLFGERQWSSPEEGGGTEWQQSVRYVAPGLLSDVIGGQIGLVQDVPTRATPGDQMAAMVAYSLIDDGERVFGDTAIRALFNDMDQFGEVFADLPAFVNDEVRFEIGNVLAEFAGLLAKNKILSGDRPEALNGVLAIAEGGAGTSLTIDFTDTTWSQSDTSPQVHDAYSKITFIGSIFEAAFGQSADPTDVQFVYHELQTWLAVREGNSLLSPFRSIDSVSITLTPGLLLDEANSSTRQLIVGSDQIEEFTISGSPAIVLAGGGSDTIFGTEGDDALIGGDGNDVLSGSSGSDFLAGGAGSDTATYALSTDPITITFQGFTSDGVAIGFHLNVEDGVGGNDELHSIETIVGTTGNDYLRIIGEIMADTDLTVHSNGGQGLRSSTINASGGTSSLILDVDGVGEDFVQVGDGKITLVGFHTNIIGSDFDDSITDDNTGNKQIDGGDGNDTISTTGTSGNVTIFGGDGNDILTGGAGDDVLFGDASLSTEDNDTDQLNGGDGNDYIITNGGGDDVNGGSGDDHLRVTSGGANILAGSGNDSIDIISSDGNVVVIGDGGNDAIRIQGEDCVVDVVVTTGGGHDAVIGDFSELAGNTLNVLIDDAPGIQIIIDAQPDLDAPYEFGARNVFQGIADVAYVLSSGESLLIEDVYVSEIMESSSIGFYLYNFEGIDDDLNNEVRNYTISFGSVNGYRIDTSGLDAPFDAANAPGTPGDDNLRGNFGDDDLSGGDGDDSFEVSGGNDTMDGGAGEDTLNVFGSRSNFTISRSGNQVVLTDLTGREGVMTLTDVEHVYFVSDGEAFWTEDLAPWPNQVPEVGEPIGVIEYAEDNAIAFAIPASAFVDPDGGDLSYSVALAGGAALPGWLSFDGAQLTGTPPADFNGSFDLEVTASDGIATASQGFRLSIDPVNDAPTITQPLLAIAVTEDGILDFLLPVAWSSDIDGDPLQFAATMSNGSALPVWLEFEDGRLTGAPPQDFNGSLELALTASDGEFAVVDHFILSVTPVNDAPAVTAAPDDRQVVEGATFEWSIPPGTFTDVDGDELALTASLANGFALPTWIAFDGTSFSGTAPANTGTFSIRVSASDGQTAISADFELTVIEDTASTGPIPYPLTTNTVAFDESEMFGTADNDLIIAAGGDYGYIWAFGFGGDDHMIVGNWNSALSGGAGVDVIEVRDYAKVAGDDEIDVYGDVTSVASTRYADYFVFNPTEWLGPGWALDPDYEYAKIVDFDDGLDKIAILDGGASLDEFADLTITQNGLDTEIYGAGIPRIILSNVASSTLDTGDFIFI